MDRPRHNDQLAVKKIGKKIKKKTPLHLPTLANAYTTSKTRLRRSIVPTQINRPHDVPPPPAMAQPILRPPMMMGHADQFWSSGDSGPLMHQSHQYQSHSPLIYNKSLPSARFSGGVGILPTPVSVCIRSPQSSFGPNRNQMQPSRDYQQPPPFNGSASRIPVLPSPRFDGQGILPTPPPGVQYPSPLKPRSFTSSSMGQGGILGPGKFPRP